MHLLVSICHTSCSGSCNTHTASASLKQRQRRGWQSLPKDSNGYLRQPSYTRLHVKVSQALLGLCESEAEQYAKEDWQEDAVMGGRHSLLPTLLCRGLSQRSHDTCHILQTGRNL